MKVLIVCVLLGLSQGLDNLKWTADCNNIDTAARDYVEDKIANSKVYLIGLTYCGWCTWAKEYIVKMGFSSSDIVVDNLDDLPSDVPYKMDIINYAYCQYSQMKTVPQVFLNQNFVGGASDTRQAYYTGAGAKAAYDSGAITRYNMFKKEVKKAAIEFVDDGVARSSGGKYLVLSKTHCRHCFAAKDCLKDAGIPDSDIELYEINDFQTHDEIKLYKGRLTPTPYTPLLAYNGKVLQDHAALVKATGCSG